MLDGFALNRREEPQENHVAVQSRVNAKPLDGVGPEDGLVVDVDVDAGLDQGIHVRAVKGVQVSGADFDRSVAPHQLMAEVDPHLGDVVVAGQDESADQIVPAVAPGLEARNLRSGDDHRLAQILQHEGQGRRGVGQRVRAVKNDESVEQLVRLFDVSGDLDPIVHGHVGGVE